MNLWGHIPNADVVPTPDDLTFGNDGERLDVCVLYADIHRSTEMVDALQDTRAAEYYKAFLHCAAKIIKSYGGEIQAYDGDRVMAVYVGNDQADRAVDTAMQINFAVIEIINPAFHAVYSENHRVLQHTVGIDFGQVLAAKTGVRVDSDLVWVGPAANYAAKLNSFDGLEIEFPTRITQQVFEKLSSSCLYGRDGTAMWVGPYNNLTTKDHYRSRFYFPIA